MSRRTKILFPLCGWVSYALHAAGLLDRPLDSTGFMRWGGGGGGSWVRICANHERVFARSGFPPPPPTRPSPGHPPRLLRN